MNKNFSDGGHSAASSLPCLVSLGHLTADKMKIKDFPKLPSALHPNAFAMFITMQSLSNVMSEGTSDSRQTLSEIATPPGKFIK